MNTTQSHSGTDAAKDFLITGGCGNLGSRLVIPLIRRGHRVVVFDQQPQPLVRSSEFEEACFVQGDLGDSENVLAAVGDNNIHTIFHLGAVLSANAEQRPEDAWAANINGTRNVLEAARICDVKRVLFSSTLATYGPGVAEPVSIDAPQWPVSLYGATKVAGERLGVYYHHRFGIDFRGIRFPAVVAPGGATGGASAFCSNVFEQAVRKGSYAFYLRPDCRCFMLYIDDAIRALLALHDADSSRLRHRVYNLAGISSSARELADTVHRRLPQVRITYEPDPALAAIVDSWPSRIDDSDARQDWDWESTFDLEQMADRVIEKLRRGPTRQ